LRAEKRLHNVP